MPSSGLCLLLAALIITSSLADGLGEPTPGVQGFPGLTEGQLAWEYRSPASGITAKTNSLPGHLGQSLSPPGSFVGLKGRRPRCPWSIPWVPPGTPEEPLQLKPPYPHRAPVQSRELRQPHPTSLGNSL